MPLLDLPNVSLTDVNRRGTRQGQIRKLLRHAEGDEYILEMDHSSSESFLTCDRSALYKLVYSRQAPPGSALIYGQAWHAALEIWYRTHDLSAAVAAAESTFIANPPQLGEWRTFDHFYQGFVAYTKQYAEEPFEIVSFNNSPMIEVPFAVPLGVLEVNAVVPYPKSQLVFDHTGDEPSFRISKLHVVWTGIVDLGIKQNGGLYVTDHKTTSITGDSYFKGFELSSQLIGYSRSLEKLIGQEVQGALVNVIVGRQPTKTGVAREFLRRYYFYDEGKKLEWERNVMAVISDFTHHLTTGYFPMKTTWCVNKFATCPYHSVCSMEPAHRLAMLHTGIYTDNIWNPID